MKEETSNDFLELENSNQLTPETKQQIKGFLESLWEIKDHKNLNEKTKDLYKKYPLVRVGIRRALVYLNRIKKHK